MKYLKRFEENNNKEFTVDDYVKFFNFMLPKLEFTVSEYVNCGLKNSPLRITHWNIDEFNYENLKKWSKMVINDGEYNSKVEFVAHRIKNNLKELEEAMAMGIDEYIDSKEIGLL